MFFVATKDVGSALEKHDEEVQLRRSALTHAQRMSIRRSPRRRSRSLSEETEITGYAMISGYLPVANVVFAARRTSNDVGFLQISTHPLSPALRRALRTRTDGRRRLLVTARCRWRRQIRRLRRGSPLRCCVR